MADSDTAYGSPVNGISAGSWLREGEAGTEGNEGGVVSRFCFDFGNDDRQRSISLRDVGTYTAVPTGQSGIIMLQRAKPRVPPLRSLRFASVGMTIDSIYSFVVMSTVLISGFLRLLALTSGGRARWLFQGRPGRRAQGFCLCGRQEPIRG